MRAFKWLCLAGLVLWLALTAAQAMLESTLSLRFRLNGTEARISDFSRTSARCRVWLVGSSPVFYGLSAQGIEEATGCAAINISLLNVHRRLNALLDQVLLAVQPGDVVVINDRSWTELMETAHACSDPGAVPCFLASWDPVPVAANLLGLLLGQREPVDRWGDALQFPPLTGRIHRAAPATSASLDSRLELIQSQVARIRARGATALLSAAPMLISPAAVPATQAQMTLLSRRVRAAIGDQAWLDPIVKVDPRWFGMEGLHPSREGRALWTGEVTRAVQRVEMPATPPSGATARGTPTAD